MTAVNNATPINLILMNTAAFSELSWKSILYINIAGNTPNDMKYKNSLILNKSKDSPKSVFITLSIIESLMITLYVSMKYAANDDRKRISTKMGLIVCL